MLASVNSSRSLSRCRSVRLLQRNDRDSGGRYTAPRMRYLLQFILVLLLGLSAAACSGASAAAPTPPRMVTPREAGVSGFFNGSYVSAPLMMRGTMTFQLSDTGRISGTWATQPDALTETPMSGTVDGSWTDDYHLTLTLNQSNPRVCAFQLAAMVTDQGRFFKGQFVTLNGTVPKAGSMEGYR